MSDDIKKYKKLIEEVEGKPETFRGEFRPSHEELSRIAKKGYDMLANASEEELRAFAESEDWTEGPEEELTDGETALQRVLRKAQEYKDAQAKQDGDKKQSITKGGFWVSPEGVVEKVKSTEYHINTITANPERFGLNREDVEGEYDETGERIGREGQARLSIIKQVLQNGWVHVRRYRNHYAVNVWTLDNRTNDNIEAFARELSEEGVDGEFARMTDEFVVYTLKNDKQRRVELRDVLRGKLFEAKEYDFHPDRVFLD